MKHLKILISITFFIICCNKIEMPYTIIEGCKDEAAFNYDSLATVDDNCCYISGCMDSLAINYIDSACIDTTQGESCIFPETWNCEAGGCINPEDGTGEFSTEEDCYNSNSCDTTIIKNWTCDSVLGCIYKGDGTGEFSTEEDCYNSCDTIKETWNCEPQGCVELGDGTGEYETKQECENNCDTVFDTLQNILIEDFTGHTCPNCPQAGAQLENIINMYPNQVVGIAIHGEHDFSRPYPLQASEFTYDFRTTWGRDIDDFFGAADNGLPVGMVNRMDYSNNHLKSKDEWLGNVNNILTNIPKFGIIIQTWGNTITVRVKVFESISDQYKIVICLTEDGIINWQKDGQNKIPDYEHKHVLRSILTSSWGGEDLKSSQSYTQDEIITKIYNINLNDLEQNNIDASNTMLLNGNGNAGGWDENNMNVVAYIYNTSNWQIEQVEEVSLIP